MTSRNFWTALVCNAMTMLFSIYHVNFRYPFLIEGDQLPYLLGLCSLLLAWLHYKADRAASTFQ